MWFWLSRSRDNLLNCHLFLWSPVTQWPHCGNIPLPCPEKSNNPCSCPETLLVAAHPSPRNVRVPCGGDFHGNSLPFAATLPIRKANMACVAMWKGRDGKRKITPKALPVVYLQRFYIYSVLNKALIQICLESYSYQFQPKNFIYVSNLCWSQKMK